MLSPVKGITMSAIGFSYKSKCSIFSYIKKTQNREKATIAYYNLCRPVFRYAEIDMPVKYADSTEPKIQKYLYPVIKLDLEN